MKLIWAVAMLAVLGGERVSADPATEPKTAAPAEAAVEAPAAAPAAPVSVAPAAPAPSKKKNRNKKGRAQADGAATPAAAPVADVGVGRIDRIEITGNKKIDKDAILEKVSHKVGEGMSREKVASDIRAIHKLGYFDSVEVSFEGGTLRFVVKERPAVYRIVFFGNDQISTDDLKNVLTIKTYDIYDENIVRESVRKLVKHYEDKGFYLAKVEHSVRASKEADMVELLFQVREYEKVKIRRITFLGNKAFSDDQLKRTLRNTSEDNLFSWASSGGNFKELDFKNDLQMLQYWYLNEGFVRFRHDPPIVTVSEDKKWVYISIKVEEGEKYNMGPVDFAGDLLFPKEELHSTLTLKEGEVFSISKRNTDILALTEKYQDLGYANVNVVPNMDINDESKTVTTNYEFEKGTLVHFGRITVKGNSKTRDKVIRRELRIREGELYSGSGMRISKENVERLGYFDPESVQFQTKSPQGRPDVLDVEVEIKERPTGQFQLGAGYASTSGFFFTTQVSESNFRGKGQDLRFQAQIAASRSDRSFRLGFTEPYAWDSNWSVGGDIYSQVEGVPNSAIEYRNGLSLSMGHPIGDYTRLYLAYRYEQLTLKNVEDPFIRTNLEREQGNLSSVALTIVNDQRNNRMETTGGHYLSFGNEFAGLGGNRDFLRTIVDGRFYHKIIGDLTFRTKVEVGSIHATTDQGVQTTERFRLGGPNNLRGYSSFTVGPTHRIGDALYVSGGIFDFIYMAELEYPLVRDVGLKAVLFYDAGDAFNKWNQVSTKQNYGWGFRWFSPLGPLRFEWGYPLKDKGNGTQFNFMIGPPF